MYKIAGNLIISFMFIFSIVTIAEAKKLKLYINDIKPESGISKVLASKTKDYFSLAIFENFNKEYQVVTDDDIKIMYKKAADLQASGRDDQTCMLQIADAINADEIIYGTMRREGGKVRLTAQNLQRNRETLEIGKKSIVNIIFYESQLEWFSKEITKKLINPTYNIDSSKAPLMISDKFRIDKIDLISVKGVDISIMKFKAEDESVSRIIDYLKEIIEKGDIHFKNKNFSKSRKKYREVLAKINTKILESKRKRIRPFIESVRNRITSIYINDFKEKIDKVDIWLKAKELMDEEISKKGLEKYRRILTSLKKIPAREREKLGEIQKTLESRLTSVYLGWILIIEKEGDSFYSDYKFKSAIEMYDKGIKKIAFSGLSNEKLTEKKNKLLDKKRIGMQTGGSWLENKVRSYRDQAEYFNIRDNKNDAKKALERAGWIIGANSLFLNSKIRSLYDEYSKLIGYEGDISSKAKFYRESRDSNYGIYSLSFMGLSALSLGGGYYFNMQLGSITSEYSSLADKYRASTDFDEATKFHNDMTAKKEEADKAELYRNISFGVGAAFLGASLYFTYKYFVYKSIESKLKTASANEVFYMPLFSYNYGSRNLNQLSSRDYFVGAVMMYRF